MVQIVCFYKVEKKHLYDNETRKLFCLLKVNMSHVELRTFARLQNAVLSTGKAAVGILER